MPIPKKKFLVCMKQRGEGCDYTIACGKDYKIMHGDSREDIEKQIIFPEGQDEYDTVTGDYALEEILIVEMSILETTHVDIDYWVKRIESNKEIAKKLEKEKEEKEEFERLKAKFGDK